MDHDHRHSNHLVAARLFWSEYQPTFSCHRQLDPYSDRHRRHPHHLERLEGDISNQPAELPGAQASIIE